MAHKLNSQLNILTLANLCSFTSAIKNFKQVRNAKHNKKICVLGCRTLTWLKYKPYWMIILWRILSTTSWIYHLSWICVNLYYRWRILSKFETLYVIFKLIFLYLLIIYLICLHSCIYFQLIINRFYIFHCFKYLYVQFF